MYLISSVLVCYNSSWLNNTLYFTIIALYFIYLFLFSQRDEQLSPVSEKLLVATQPKKVENSNKRLTKREKLLVGFITFLLSVFVLLAVVFGSLYMQVRSNSPIQEGSTKALHQSVYPCVTKDCVITSTGNAVRVLF